MTGKYEEQLRIEQHIELLIKWRPSYIRDYWLHLNSKSIKTQKAYIEAVLHYIDYLNEAGEYTEDTNVYTTIKHNDINAYIGFKKQLKNQEREASESHLRVILSALKAFFEFLIDEGIIEHNPCLRIKLQKQRVDKPIIALTPEEVRIMKHQASQNPDPYEAIRDVAILHLGFHTGIRASAIVNLNIDDLILDDKKIVVREKENVTKEVYLDDTTTSVMIQWLEKRKEWYSFSHEGFHPWYDKESEAVFIKLTGRNARMGGRMILDEVNKMVKRVSEGIDKDISTHKMRSTFATNVYENTNDIYMVSELLGHARIDTTKRYTKMSEERRRNVIDNVVENMY